LIKKILAGFIEKTNLSVIVICEINIAMKIGQLSLDSIRTLILMPIKGW